MIIIKTILVIVFGIQYETAFIKYGTTITTIPLPNPNATLDQAAPRALVAIGKIYNCQHIKKMIVCTSVGYNHPDIKRG